MKYTFYAFKSKIYCAFKSLMICDNPTIVKIQRYRLCIMPTTTSVQVVFVEEKCDECNKFNSCYDR